MSAKLGSAHHLAKLTEDDVREMRRRRAAGEKVQAIWLDYPDIQSQHTVWCVLTGRTWRHVK